MPDTPTRRPRGSSTGTELASPAPRGSALVGQFPRGDRPPARLVTIGRSSEIERTSREGRSRASRLFVMVCLETPDGPPRLAIKASRKLGGAVVRNRLRRQIKEIMRVLFSRLARPCDCLIIGRTEAVRAPFARKREDLEQLLRRHGYLVGAGRQRSQPPSAGSV